MRLRHTVHNQDGHTCKNSLFIHILIISYSVIVLEKRHCVRHLGRATWSARVVYQRCWSRLGTYSCHSCLMEDMPIRIHSLPVGFDVLSC